MPSPCFGQILNNKQELSKIEGLSPDMQKLWITTKLNQLDILTHNGLEPVKETISLMAVDTMSRIHNTLKPYKTIVCSISGGSDSDVIMDILARSTDRFKDIHFIFFDTGVEYQATKQHLDDLEKKYGITIERRKAVKSIPYCCKTFGQPFMSKRVSELIARLQEHDFRWEDEPIDVLEKRYPRCRAALRWWTNDFGSDSKFNISYNKGLKEFMVLNPPTFKISAKCCDYAKKKVAKNYETSIGCDLVITGVRKAEGGIRADAYKTCLTQYDSEKVDHFRPIFWFKDEDKLNYEESCGVVHSDCYTRYGLKRTGCAGCPFGKKFEDEIEVIEKFEPNLYTAINNIFGESYEYTRKYREFVKNEYKGII